MKKAVKYLFKTILAIYVIACIGLYFQQDELIFNPRQLDENFRFRAGEEVEVPVSKNISLNCLWVKESRSNGVILYLHGNRGSNRRCLRQAEMFMNNGYDIFMPDYRGYGKSEGQMDNEEQAFSDMQRVYDHLLTMYREDQIHILGYSLGTAMATHLAANNDPRHLFLVAPYLSFVDLKNRIFPLIPNFLIRFPFRTERMIHNVSSPITIFHGTDDEVIPHDSSVQLNKIKPSIDFISLPGVGHRGTIFDSKVRRVVRNKLRI